MSKDAPDNEPTPTRAIVDENSPVTALELRQMSRDISEIKLGMFGNKHVGHRGLIERVMHIESWITKANLKIALVTGIFTAVMFVCKMVWDFITTKK